MNYYELEVEPIFENLGIRIEGPCERWRMNLLAVSQVDKSIMFVAMENTIYVYRLSLLNGKPGEPIKKLKCFVDSEPSWHIINAIKVGMIGNKEVLVSVDDVGYVFIWFTDNLDKNPIKFNNNKSTWGITLHGPKCLLAVSSNLHEITIFNLQETILDEFDEDNNLNNSEPQRHASVLTRSSDNNVSVLRGHKHNIPNICFSSCGQFLVSCSIDATCRIWSVKTGEEIQTKTISNGYYLNYNEEWGWSTHFVPKHAFKPVSSNCRIYQDLISNLPSQSPQSVETIDSLDLYPQHLRHNPDGRRIDLQDLYRTIIYRGLALRNSEYENGYIDTEEEINTEGSGDDSESNEDNEDNEDNENDMEEELINDSGNEGNATPAYYDRDESATSVVESYTESNPDYRWSVGHELNILNNIHNDSSSISEREVEERSEEIISSTQNNTFNASSPTYSHVQPQNVSEGRESISSHDLSLALDISELEHMESITMHDDDNISSEDLFMINSHAPSSSREGINNGPIIDSLSRIPGTLKSNYHKRIEPFGSPRLPDGLVLYTTKNDLFLLDPKSNLRILHTEKNMVCKVDTRNLTLYSDYDRLNMIEVIPELSLAIVASQQGTIALTRLIKLIDDNGDESYCLYPEKYLPTTRMNVPLLGMFVAKHDKLQDPSLYYYRLYLMYCNSVIFCYEIRRRKETNPLRLDNIFI